MFLKRIFPKIIAMAKKVNEENNAGSNNQLYPIKDILNKLNNTLCLV